MQDLLTSIRQHHVDAVNGFFANCSTQLVELAHLCAERIEKGNKLIFCGNGGSACDAMHIAGEFVGRFVDDRRALPALALSADTGIITAIANDYNYDYIFARQIEGLGQKGDILIGMSTSGSSPNIVKAIESAKKIGILTVLFTGEKGKENPPKADKLLVVPSKTTAHVQEAHMVGLHGLASLIEKQLFA